MKAEELMIGDWVHFYDIESARQINYLTVNSSGGCGPIPITAEILDANGFNREDIKYDSYVFKTDTNLTIDFLVNHSRLIVKDYDGWAIIDLKIRFVHELQHALRLCGLTDLANDFKIK